MDKTLVEQLREIVELSIASNQYPTVHADVIIGHLCVSNSDERELFTAIADRIESEYMELPMLEGEPLNIGDKVDCLNGEIAEVFAVMNNKTVVINCISKPYPLTTWDVCDLKRHRKEVLDADGVPIHVGDTVYSQDGKSFTVQEIMVDYDDDERTVFCGEYRKGFKVWRIATDLTHKQPDTLDRIDEDAAMAAIDYCSKYGLLDIGCNGEEGDDAVRHCTDCSYTCEERMVRHLLRRQREVLESGQA